MAVHPLVTAATDRPRRAGVAAHAVTPERAVLRLPPERGPLSGWVLQHLCGRRVDRPVLPLSDPFDDDLQLALYCCFESHFSDLPGVTVDVEWDVDLLAFRRELEDMFERGLRERVGLIPVDAPARERIPEMIASDTGPSLSQHMERAGTLGQMREFVVHRSAYQLKEADGHTFGIPRLTGTAKQLLATIQAGEYGTDGEDRVMHAALFAQTMRELGLDDRLHAYLDVLPGSALAISNITSLFGLNRRWRGALVGHLAVFEMTSVVPMDRYSRALAKIGASPEARRFYDVHVLADTEHEVLALDMADSLAVAQPALRGDILFGAACALLAEQRFAGTLLSGWGVAPAG